MALFVNSCFIVVLNFGMMLLLEAYYDLGLNISNGVKGASLVLLDKYPFVVLVNLTIKKTYCTGALISQTFVLTVAHCVSEESDTSAMVYRGHLDDIYVNNVQNSTTNTTVPVLRNGYEERKSVLIIHPWLYKRSTNLFDIALIKVDRLFVGNKFMRTTLLTPFIRFNVMIKCKAVGFNVDSFPYSFSNKRDSKMLLEERTMLVKKQCKTKHNTVGTCSGIPWIVQQEEQYVDPSFANSAALLLCSSSASLKATLNGIAKGKIDSSGTSNVTDYPLSFTDICPYLSWIRSYAGPTVIRSPGICGKSCYGSSSSIRTRDKSRISWFVTIVIIFCCKYSKLLN